MIWLDPRVHVALYAMVTLLFWGSVAYVAWLALYVRFKEIYDRLEKLEK